MAKAFKVSQSKVKLWRQCKEAYYYRYVEEIERIRVARPLVFGRLVHEMVEADANQADPFKVLDEAEAEQGKLFKSEREFYGDIIEDVECIMVEYFDFWKSDRLKYIKIGKRRAEHEFEVEVESGIVVTGKVDAFAERSGLNWLVEHKSFGPIPPPDDRWRDLQTAVYVKIGDMLGWPEIDGLLWDYIKSKAPTRPKLLKSGKLSAAAIDTLPETVFREIRKHKINPSAPEAKTLLKMARDNRSAYFLRVPRPLKPNVVDFIFSDFMTTVREMRQRHGTVRELNIGRHCSWCDFEGLCRARLQGADVDFIKKREYRARDEKPNKR